MDSRSPSERLRDYERSEYWSGAHCMKLGMPWWTPSAIRRFLSVDQHWLKTASVIELGSGGSTLLFGELCHIVMTLETSVDWAGKVLSQLGPLTGRVAVVTATHGCELDELERLVAGHKFDIALIDGDPSRYSRSKAASIILPRMKQDAIFITDNYFLKDNIVDEFTRPSEWRHEDFNDTRWHGCGTRLSFR